MEKWWFADKEVVARELGTDMENGLTAQEVTDRQQKYGPNQLGRKKRQVSHSLFLDQFKDFMIWVLIGAALVSGFLKEWVDAIAIICIVILNAILGFIQEYRAEKSLAALKSFHLPLQKLFVMESIR